MTTRASAAFASQTPRATHEVNACRLGIDIMEIHPEGGLSQNNGWHRAHLANVGKDPAELLPIFTQPCEPRSKLAWVRWLPARRTSTTLWSGFSPDFADGWHNTHTHTHTYRLERHQGAFTCVRVKGGIRFRWLWRGFNDPFAAAGLASLGSCHARLVSSALVCAPSSRRATLALAFLNASPWGNLLVLDIRVLT